MSALHVDQQRLQQLSSLGAEALLQWAAQQGGQRAAIVTSFQHTGCVMIDMAYRAGLTLRVATIDTLRLHPETYALMERIEQRYQVRIERFQPRPQRVERMVAQHGEFLFFDSKAKQEYCCRIRKVEPNERCLETLDIWITGLRKDQSKLRQQTQKASLIDAPSKPDEPDRAIVKLAPLADYTEAHLANYINQHEVPYNALYDQGYKSIGCVICSTPVMPWEDARAGRWRWFNQLGDQEANKECGIHIGGSGI